MRVRVSRAKSLKGTVKLPGDKSISHRAALISAIAEGTSKIENFSASADCSSTLRCLEKLGVRIERNASTVRVHGVGKEGLRSSNEPLDCGNSGTTARLLAGILAGQNFQSCLTGDESLSRRPMRRVIEPLEMMGASIEATQDRLPMKIRGRSPLKAISYQMKVTSAQVKSCILLAGLFADGKTQVAEAVSETGQPILTRDHTERMLATFGAEIEKTNGTIAISGNSKLKAVDFTVPCDISAAAFFLVAAFCLENSELLLPNIGINPTRDAIIKVLRNAGAEIRIENRREECGEPVADLRISSSQKSDVNVPTLRGEIIANLIDEIPILAVLGTQLESGLEVRDASELRVKESDRISITVENLRRMNAKVKEFPDGFRVERSNLVGAEIDSAGDHRIAMAFAVAGLLAQGETVIENAECVAISFPDFFEVLHEVVTR